MAENSFTENFAFVTLRGQTATAGGKTMGVEQNVRKSGRLWKLHSKANHQHWTRVWVSSSRHSVCTRACACTGTN